MMFYSLMMGVKVYDVSFGNLWLCAMFLIFAVTDGMGVQKAIETKVFIF